MSYDIGIMGVKMEEKEKWIIKCKIIPEFGNREFIVDEVDDNTAFIVVVEVLESTNVGYIWPPYGGWYPWYPGGYYPWYPWGPSYYSYQTGTVRVHLGDWKNRDEANDKIKYVYLGAINGLMQGSSSYVDARVKAGIDQLFSQAPFPIPAN